MANDFRQFYESSPQVKNVIDKLNIDPTPLCKPKASNLYKSASESPLKSRLNRIRGKEGLSPNFSKSRTVNNENEEFGKRKTFITETVPSPRKQSLEPNIDDKAKHLTAASLVLSPLSTEDLYNTTKKMKTREEKLEELVNNIQQHMGLPTLLVDQRYAYRDKRYKKYSEPLSSVRHEDLLSQHNIPSKKDDLDEQIKVHKVNMRFTRRVLSKAKKAQKNQPSKLYQKFLPKETIQKFPEPDPAAELERLERAEEFLLQKNESFI